MAIEGNTAKVIEWQRGPDFKDGDDGGDNNICKITVEKVNNGYIVVLQSDEDYEDWNVAYTRHEVIKILKGAL